MLLTVKNGIISNPKPDFNFSTDKWNIWFKGYFFVDENYYASENACRYILEHLAKDTVNPPHDLNGIFVCIILNKENQQITILNDRFGFRPLFYSTINNEMILGDDFWEVAKEVNTSEIDETSLLEFLQYRFVSGKYTLAKDIFCIEPASVYCINSKDNNIQITREEYWTFKYTPGIESKAVAEKEIYSCQKKIISKYKQAAFQDKKIGLNLTGGLDSRFLLGLLMQNDIPKKQIEFFTFGSSSCEDIKISAKIADTLDISHHKEIFDDSFVDFFDKKNIKDILSELGFFSYYLQGYGFKKLNKINSQLDFILTGTDGFCVAAYAGKKLFEVQTIQEAVDYIYSVNASMLSEKECEGILRDKTSSIQQKLKDRILNEQINTNLDPISIFYDWSLKNRNRKYLLSNYEIINTNAVYLMPFYDYGFIDLMAKMSPSLIKDQPAYVNSMFQNVFVDELEALKNIPIEKRGIYRQRGEDFVVRKKARISPGKIIEKLLNPSDNIVQYPIQKTLRTKKHLLNTIIEKLIPGDSTYLNKADCVKLIRKMKRSNEFTRYGLVVIISILQFEKMLKNIQSVDK